VARWIVVGGRYPHDLHRLAAASWNGLDTAITLTTGASHVSVVAEDEDGRRIDQSAVVPVAPN
jgi:hypothetical protein